MIKLSRGCCGKEELDQVKEAFDYGYFGLAYKVNEFEDKLQEYIGEGRKAIAVNTGTSALHIALDSINIKYGDEVILPSFTFVATAQAISCCGGKPVFCDVNKDTMLMDIDDVKRKITPKTKAIIPVHYAGAICDMDALLELKEQYNIRIIEDAAHAIGSVYKGKKVGSFGDITCFSFDSIKVMTCGEGGAVVTGDAELAEIIMKKRLLGIDRKSMHTKDWKKRSWIYDVPFNGYRYHMSNINAAIGVAQLSKIDKFIKRRREICKLYLSELSNVNGIQLPVCDFDNIAPFMFVIRVDNNKRDALKQYLMEHDIESGISYIPCHHFSYYKQEQPIPVSDTLFSEILCLPLHFELSDSDALEVTNCIKDFMEVK
ncbi:MAG: DegT/DnrJ/EryC1/StrS family aminotransferase [Ruminococcaceae bacterium]|jgi:perosamine synthetase|nr:DegT/DnrJ/EryC1/StrS family aminotransferase [Oscillospiraceae bacterium]